MASKKEDAIELKSVKGEKTERLSVGTGKKQ